MAGGLEMQADARAHARKQWNALACGELEGDKTTAAYFDAVDQDRFEQVEWALDYFGFHHFAGKKVLEIGVGQGTDLMRFARSGAECYGVDITRNHLNLTQMNFNLRGKAVDLREADATAIPFPDNHFDCVYSFGVLHHIPEIELVLAEARRVLKPGGKLMIALYHKWSASHAANVLAFGLLRGKLFSIGYSGLLATIERGADGVSIKPYVRLYGKRETKAILTKSGFAVEDVSCHQFFAEHMLLPTKKPNRPLPFANLFGWYVAARATKAG